MTYLVIAIGPGGNTRCIFTTTPEIPENWVQPGEVAFVIQPLAISETHTHGVPR